MRAGVLVTAAPSPAHAALLAPAGLGAQRRAFRPLCRSTHGISGSDIAGGCDNRLPHARLVTCASTVIATLLLLVQA